VPAAFDLRDGFAGDWLSIAATQELVEERMPPLKVFWQPG
jgi:hypothetical protein